MQNDSLLELSPMLRQILIENVLEEDPETFDINQQLTPEQAEKVIGFMKAMEYTQSKATRKQKRSKVRGQFSNHFRLIVNQKNNAKSDFDGKNSAE